METTQMLRLQKYFTDCGVLSRRAAEEEIEKGNVLVNGEPAFIGQKVNPDTDTVTWNGEVVRPIKGAGTVTLLLNKPAGYVTTTSDEEGRPCVIDLLGDDTVRVYPVGRLDINSTGLLLLTNDGELANLLTHPKSHIPKVYQVSVGGEISDAALRKLSSPMTIDGYRLQPVKVSCLYAYEHMSMLEMTLYEGRNRQIRKMCAAVGLHILSLQRISIGPLTIGHLQEGKYRRLAPTEVEALKNIARRIAYENEDKVDFPTNPEAETVSDVAIEEPIVNETTVAKTVAVAGKAQSRATSADKKPARKYDDKPRGDYKPARKFDDKPRGDYKPARKFDDKPRGDYKPARKFDDKPRSEFHQERRSDRPYRSNPKSSYGNNRKGNQKANGNFSRDTRSAEKED